MSLVYTDITSLLGGGTTNVIASGSGYTILPSPPVVDVTRQIISINEDPTLNAQQKADAISRLSGIPASYVNDPANAQVNIAGVGLITNKGVNSSSPVPTDPNYFGINKFGAPMFGGPGLVGVDPNRVVTSNLVPSQMNYVPVGMDPQQAIIEQFIRQYGGPPPRIMNPVSGSSVPDTVSPSSTSLGAVPNQISAPSQGGFLSWLSNNTFIIIFAIAILILLLQPHRPNIVLQRAMMRKGDLV